MLIVSVRGTTKYIGASSTSGSQQTLEERARQAGGRLIISDDSPNRIAYNDLADIADNSSAIVIGVAVSNRCRLSADGQYITTDYQVNILESLKGDMPQGMITVRTPGGLRVFDKSTSAFIQVPHFRRPINGGTYVFFLGPDYGNNTFPLAGGFQGAFKLSTDGKVTPSDDRPASPLRQRHKGKDNKEFLKELRAVLKDTARSFR
jgi:hypothetical protein